MVLGFAALTPTYDAAFGVIGGVRFDAAAVAADLDPGAGRAVEPHRGARESPGRLFVPGDEERGEALLPQDADAALELGLLEGVDPAAEGGYTIKSPWSREKAE